MKVNFAEMYYRAICSYWLLEYTSYIPLFVSRGHCRQWSRSHAICIG